MISAPDPTQLNSTQQAVESDRKHVHGASGAMNVLMTDKNWNRYKIGPVFSQSRSSEHVQNSTTELSWDGSGAMNWNKSVVAQFFAVDQWQLAWFGIFYEYLNNNMANRRKKAQALVGIFAVIRRRQKMWSCHRKVWLKLHDEQDAYNNLFREPVAECRLRNYFWWPVFTAVLLPLGRIVRLYSMLGIHRKRMLCIKNTATE